jgi:hypothetical protein
VSEPPSSSVAASSATVTSSITSFFQTEAYQTEIQCLDVVDFQSTPNETRSSGAWISALLVDWTEVMAMYAGNQVEVLR